MALAPKFWTLPAIEIITFKDKKGDNQLSLEKWMYKAPDQEPRAKIIWGRNTSKILSLIKS